MKKDLIYAIDFGGLSTKAAIFEKKSKKLLTKWVYYPGIGEKVVPNFHKELLNKLKENGWTYDQVKVVSLLVKCAYDAEKGIALHAPGTGWYDYPVRDRMREHFGKTIPLLIANDAEGALLASWKFGSGKQFKSFLFLIIGRGVGSGILLDNKIWKGAHGFAGEIGHGGKMQTRYDCGDDVGTCVEGSSSAYAMEKTFTDYVLKHPEATQLKALLKKGQKRISLKDVAPLIIAKDPLTLSIFNHCLEPLAQRLALSEMLLDVEGIVIGGGPSALGEHLTGPLTKLMRKYCWQSVFSFEGRKFKLVPAKLGGETGIYGALANVEYNGL